jgi:hypothetical protein
MSIFRGHVLESRALRPETMGRYHSVRGMGDLSSMFGKAGQWIVNLPSTFQTGVMSHLPGGAPPPEAPYEMTSTSRTFLAPLPRPMAPPPGTTAMAAGARGAPVVVSPAEAYARAQCQGVTGPGYGNCMTARMAAYQRAIAQCARATGMARGNCMNAMLR